MLDTVFEFFYILYVLDYMSMKFDHIICHYGEISLKGGNRNYFEAQLIRNIKKQLQKFSPGSFEFVQKISGAILLKLTELGIKNISQIEDALMHTFGIVNFSYAKSIPQDLEKIKKAAWEIIKNENFESFRVTTIRSNKQFPSTSAKLDIEIGGYLFKKLDRRRKVSLKNPNLNLFVAIVNDYAFIYLHKIKGLGGMPVGTGGKAMALMSGGFDSPVAAWQILKRGVQLRYIHFHSMPYTSKASVEKVAELIRVLEKYGASTKLFLVPFADIQKEIMLKAPDKFRIILYRRMMLRIAEKIGKSEKCQALITGDSIAQVASQTLENILAVSEAATLPIFRPLIGLDKEEIMQKAQSIGTYAISILAHDDCCTRLMPKKPETKAKLPEVLLAEKNLNIDLLLKKILKKIEKKQKNTP